MIETPKIVGKLLKIGIGHIRPIDDETAEYASSSLDKGNERFKKIKIAYPNAEIIEINHQCVYWYKVKLNEGDNNGIKN